MYTALTGRKKPFGFTTQGDAHGLMIYQAFSLREIYTKMMLIGVSRYVY
jgi:hypothetical protein